MFCNKCGKFIDYDSIVCNECAQQYYKNNVSSSTNTYYHANDTCGLDSNKVESEKVQTYNVEQVPITPIQNQPNSRMLGFGKALISAILPEIALILSSVCIFSFALTIQTNSSYIRIPMSMLMISGAFAVNIVAMVLSSQSILLVRKTVANGGVRPVATQILGIVGRVTSIITMVVLGLFLIAMVSIFIGI